MAAVQFTCPHCSGVFQVDSGMAGQPVACPHCGGVVVIPEMGPYSVPPPTPQPPSVAPVQVAPVVPRQSTPPGPQPVRPVPVQPRSPSSPLPTTKQTSTNRPLPVSPKPVSRPTPVSPVSPVSVPQDGAIRLREPVKTVGRGDDEIELRSLSPEEKARRRMIKNLVLWGVGFVIIAVTLAVLLMTGPIQVDH